MTRFATIDTNSGYVWGVIDANLPADACRLIDEDCGEHGNVYEEVSHLNGRGGYEVYEVPFDFFCNDGSVQAEIDAVEAFPLMWKVLTTQPAEETFSVGETVEGGDIPEDFDVGFITDISGDQIAVNWDSGVSTTQSADLLRPHTD